MSKVYKGYELLKAIADGEIKEDTKFREMEENRYYIVKDRKLWEKEDTGIYNSKLESLQITYGVFELIEDEVDIDNIEELLNIEEYEVDKTDVVLNRNKINELIKAVKQLNKEIKSIKEKKYEKFRRIKTRGKN